LAPEWAVHVLRWSPRGSNWNFLQLQVASGFSAITGIWAPMEVEKNVCQRRADQVSSRRWDLICPSQLIGLKKRIRLGASSSWDSRPAISVRSTESSTVATMRCCERRLMLLLGSISFFFFTKECVLWTQRLRKCLGRWIV
jgi:hypothetical protein